MRDDTGKPGRALGERIEQIRRERGVSVEKLAELAEVDRSQLRSISDGVDVGISSMIRLAGALGVDLDELLDGIDWSPGDEGEYRVRNPGGA